MNGDTDKNLEIEEEDSKQQKFSSFAYVILFVVFFTGIVFCWSQYKVTAVIPTIITDLNISAAAAGWIMGAFNLCGVILAFPGLILLRKWGVKKAGLIAVVVGAIGTILGYFANEEILLIGSRVIEGFGIGMISVIAPTVITMWFPLKKRGFPMGLWSSWQMVAVAAAFLFSIGISNAFGTWKGMWIVGIILFVVAFVLYALFVKSPPDNQNYADSEDTSVKLTSVLKYASPWIVCIGGLGFGIACTVFVTWVATFWITMGGLDLATANNFIVLVFVGEIVWCIVAGLALNKIRRRRYFIVVAAVLYAIVYFLAFTLHTFPGIVFVVVTYALIEGCFTAAMWTLIGQTVPDYRLTGGAIAMYTIAINLGMVIGAPLAGALVDMGSWTGVAILSCVTQLVAAIAFAALKLYDEKGRVAKI